jgi:hypothetical protein
VGKTPAASGQSQIVFLAQRISSHIVKEKKVGPAVKSNIRPSLITTTILERSAGFLVQGLEAAIFASMASDEIIWQIINHQFCAFKLK